MTSQLVTGISHTSTTPLWNSQVKRDCFNIQKQFLHQVCGMPGSEMLEFTELGINVHQPLAPTDRKQSRLTNQQNLKTSEMVYVFRQSVGARTAGEAGKGPALIFSFVSTYSNLSTTGEPSFSL